MHFADLGDDFSVVGRVLDVCSEAYLHAIFL